MEQQMQYLMWLKSKQIFKSHYQPSMNSSWEEQAFAEDAAALGGFTWPPRSYSCTFCRREFKSAQALGGHMNVHRRDRARLKQSQAHTETKSPPPNSPETGDSGSPYSSLSSTTTTTTTLPILSKNPVSPQGSDTSNSGMFLSLSNQDKPTRGIYNNQDVIVLDSNKDIVDTNLSLGINLMYESYDNEESYNISSKRQRLMISNDMNSLQFASKRYVTSYISDNIDLELRLG